MKKVLNFILVLAILFVTGCGSDNKSKTEEQEEDPWFVPWSKAHLSDHVMKWNGMTKGWKLLSVI